MVPSDRSTTPRPMELFVASVWAVVGTAALVGAVWSGAGWRNAWGAASGFAMLLPVGVGFCVAAWKGFHRRQMVLGPRLWLALVACCAAGLEMGLPVTLSEPMPLRRKVFAALPVTCWSAWVVWLAWRRYARETGQRGIEPVV